MEDVTKDFTNLYAPRSTTSQQEAGNWIADLFTPTFACTVEDISNGKLEEEATPLESKIKRVPAFDPGAIQDVYHKVRLMNLMDEEMQKQKLQKIRSKSVVKVKDDNEEERLNLNRDSASIELASKEVPEDLENSHIWDSEELAVLRKVFKSAKNQISDLKVQLRNYEARNSHLEAVVKKQEHVIEKADIKLRETTKANKRLKIHCDNLQYQLNHSGAKVDTVTDMWKEIDIEKSKMLKEIQEVRLAHEKERLLRENLELKLENVAREQQRSIDIAIQNTQVKYEKQILVLRKEIKELSEEYLKEKQTYGVTSKALNHLRHHFASLPYEDIIPPNSVSKDEVTNINFVS